MTCHKLTTRFLYSTATNEVKTRVRKKIPIINLSFNILAIIPMPHKHILPTRQLNFIVYRMNGVKATKNKNKKYTVNNNRRSIAYRHYEHALHPDYTIPSGGFTLFFFLGCCLSKIFSIGTNKSMIIVDDDVLCEFYEIFTKKQ